MSLLWFVPTPTTQTVTPAPAVSGPYAPGPGITQPDTVTPPIVARLIDRSDWSIKATLDQTWDRTWENQLNEPGAGELRIDNTDPDLALIDDDDLIRFELHGSADIVIMPNDIDRQTIAEAEEVDEATTIRGPGHLAVLEEAVVYPSRGVGVRPIQEDRPFSWASVEFDDSWWEQAHEITGGVTDWWSGVGSWPGGLSSGLGSVWIWDNAADYTWAPAGDVFFRRDFTVPADGIYTIAFLADDRGHFYIDGQKVLETRNWTNSDADTATEDVELTAGSHTAAVWAQNNPGQLGNNPAGIRVIVAPRNLDGTLGTPVCVSDGNWKVLPRPIYPLGMTPGEVMRLCISEAQARGALTGVTTTFTDDVDSAGIPWGVSWDIATKVGTDYLTFFRELTNSYVDLWMSPAGFELWAWQKNGRGDDVDVSLSAPTDPDDPTSGLLYDLRHRRQP